ncbi:MAG: hypothetical protein HY515_02480 [Candidatus Aenigmarchaeota archaeon]|nr:hypothetical protein [Candidatus Aenigmarchaeota archaeon]
MSNFDLQKLEGDFEHYEEGPWPEEEKLVKIFFQMPLVRLTSVIFGDSDRLPYWDFTADAKRHALKGAREGVTESDVIVDDYKTRIWEPTKSTILGEGEYALLIEEAIRSLPKKFDQRVQYEQIMRKRFGFDGKPQGIPSIAKEFDLAKERVRRLEGRAFSILRHPSRSDAIKSYLEQKRWEFIGYLHREVYTS